MPYTVCEICGARVCHPIGGFFCNHEAVRDEILRQADSERESIFAGWLKTGDISDPARRAIYDSFQDCTIFQDVTELLWLYDLLSGKVESVLEIGAYQGGTALLWERLFGAEVISIDLKQMEPYAANRERLIVADSRDLETVKAVKARRAKYDMVFIDGDHSAEGVESDYRLYGGMARKGGVVVFHDTLWDYHTVGLFFNSLDGEKKSFARYFGLGVLFK